jgi:hypothetical protein
MPNLLSGVNAVTQPYPLVRLRNTGTAVTRPAQGTEANTVAHHARPRSTCMLDPWRPIC